MKYLIASILLGSGIAASAAVQSTELLLFNQNNFEGWQYTRSDIELSQKNISLDKIRLFKQSTGTDLVLISPSFDCAGNDSLSVAVEYKMDNTTFTASKLALSYIIKDEENNVLADTTVKVKSGVIQQTLEATIPVNSISGPVTLTLAAFKADMYNCGAVRNVRASGLKVISLYGDVNGDGTVDVTDVNAVINAIMSSNNDHAFDVNGDGVVDITDANSVLNIILKS